MAASIKYLSRSNEFSEAITIFLLVSRPAKETYNTFCTMAVFDVVGSPLGLHSCILVSSGKGFGLKGGLVFINESHAGWLLSTDEPRTLVCNQNILPARFPSGHWAPHWVKGYLVNSTDGGVNGNKGSVNRISLRTVFKVSNAKCSN